MGFINDRAGRVPLRMVKRNASALPATASQNIFSCNGLVKIIGMVGVVTTAIQDQICNLTLTYDPDSAGANVNMHIATAITANAIGTVMVVPGAVAAALTEATEVSYVVATSTPMIMSAGKVLWTTSATNTGAVEWYITYEPLKKTNGKWASIVAI